MPEQRTITVYKYDELSDDAKVRARAWFTKDWPLPEWWLDTYDTIDDVAKSIGFYLDKDSNDNIRIFFSLDYYRHVTFSGTYNYESPDKLDTEWPVTAKFKQLIESHPELVGVSFLITTDSRHQLLISDIESDIEVEDHEYDEVPANIVSACHLICKGFSQWVLSFLQQEYDYLTSESYIANFFQNNNYIFTIFGDVAVID